MRSLAQDLSKLGGTGALIQDKIVFKELKWAVLAEYTDKQLRKYETPA